MSRIKIKHFGPIKNGYLDNEGWLDVKRVTVLIGNQGSGKSTVAKLISTLTWVEKSMFLGTLKQNSFNTKKRFEKLLSYQKIDKYLRDETVIEYEGYSFRFNYIEGKFLVSKSKENGYLLPKIMYAPAERNFLSSVDRPDKLKNLPQTLYTFNDEFDAAKEKFGKGTLLPFGNTKFIYDKLNKLARIIGINGSFDLRLSEASSGYQSTVPLFLVTKYISESLVNKPDEKVKENSLEEQKKLDKELKLILNDPELTPEVRQASLRLLSAKRKRACFINIVEEPEQNLFPTSQKSMLFELLSHTQTKGNKLIITTHSPYLINYLTIAVKASMVLEKLYDSDAKTKLSKIVPLESVLKASELAIYEMNEEDGSIRLLDNYKGLPSDENYLNASLDNANELFTQLQELKKGWQ